MECLLEANPDPDITWYQGDKSIADSPRVRMLRKTTAKDTFLLTLEISNPTRQDGGNYRCNAFNVYGESNANIALNFQGMPQWQQTLPLYVCELSTFRCYSTSSNLFQQNPDQYDQYNNFCMSMALNCKPVSGIRNLLYFQVEIMLLVLHHPSSKNQKLFQTKVGLLLL